MSTNKFSFLLGIVIFITPVFTKADDWKKNFVVSVFKIISISKELDMEMTENITKENSLVLCCIKCAESVSFYHNENNGTCICNSGTDERAEENKDVNGKWIYGIKASTITTFSLQVFKRIHKQPEAHDCLELFQQGYTGNGVYVIKPVRYQTDIICAATIDGCELNGSAIDVWCDMTNGGWTVIQRRQDGFVDFYKDWNDYQNGFGNVIGEYWLGLENIHILTSDSSSLHVEMETFGDVTPRSAYAEYSSFMITDEIDKYRLIIGGFQGSCQDSLLYHHNGSQFSTRDRDNDFKSGSNCAITSTGAWWYNRCLASNLNGQYLGGAGSTFAQGIVWVGCWNHEYSLKGTVMKIKRNV